MRLVLVLLLLVPFAATPASAAPLADLSNIEALRAEALRLVNADRKRKGLAPLERDETLERASQEHAEDMARRRYFKHRGRDGRTAFTRYKDAGGNPHVTHGENLAACYSCKTPGLARVAKMQKRLMNSRGHRSNIMHERFTRFGFGIAYRPGANGRGRAYAVQTFSSTPQSSAERNRLGLAIGSVGPAEGVRRVVRHRKSVRTRVVKRRSLRKMLRWPFGRKRTTGRERTAGQKRTTGR